MLKVFWSDHGRICWAFINMKKTAQKWHEIKQNEHIVILGELNMKSFKIQIAI